MDDDELSIGQMAHASGLPISALRFYDTAGVVVPAHVDPVSRYRIYRADQVGDARLVARLRSVGMSVPDIAAVLRAAVDPGAATRAIDLHLRSLVDGLTDAERVLRQVREQLPTEAGMNDTQLETHHLTLPGTALQQALRTVRYAVSTDAALAYLQGVLVERQEGSVTVTATDRYRLAVSTIAGSFPGPDFRVLLSCILVDGLLDITVPADGKAELSTDGTRVRTEMAGYEFSAAATSDAFPDVRRLTSALSGTPVVVERGELHRHVEAARTWTFCRENDGIDYEVCVLTTGPEGQIAMAHSKDHAGGIGVNREFLLEALGSGVGQELVLDLDGPVGPIALRDPADPGSFSVLMPTRLI